MQHFIVSDGVLAAAGYADGANWHALAEARRGSAGDNIASPAAVSVESAAEHR